MKTILLGTTALAFFASSAMAADMPVKAPPIAAVAAYNWTGCYIGAHGGWGQQRSDNSFSGTGVDPFFPEENVNGGGGVAGGHVGCNWQRDRLVFGIEGDGTWTRIRGDDSGIGGDINELELRWLASVRGRIGITFFGDRWLSYITGGGAWAGASSNVLDPGRQETVNRTISGWTVGWGTEYGFTDNLSGRLETRYYWFGQEGFQHNFYLERFNDLRLWTVTVGLTYRFGGPVVARY